VSLGRELSLPPMTTRFPPVARTTSRSTSPSRRPAPFRVSTPRIRAVSHQERRSHSRPFTFLHQRVLLSIVSAPITPRHGFLPDRSRAQKRRLLP
jgi:hypothetical protein